MASIHSAGIVLYRPTGHHGLGADDEEGAGTEDGFEILLVHPGGPFWAGKDEHGWSIPKGEFDPGTEPAVEAAHREFAEELGRPVPGFELQDGVDPDGLVLDPFRAGRKTIHAVLVAGDFDADRIESNTVDIEWPPRSGRVITVPEVDRAAWFSLTEARTKLHKGQIPLVDRVVAALSK